MKPLMIRWGKVRSGLYYCFLDAEEIHSYLFLEVRDDGLGELYEHGEHSLYWLPPRMTLKQAKGYIKNKIYHEWMEENQHIWTRADK